MPSYTFTENTTAQNTSDTPTTGTTTDTAIVEAESTSNFGGDSYTETSRFGGSDHQNTLLGADTSSIVDSETVTSADLHWYHTSNNGESHTINIYENLVSGWTEGGGTWATSDGSTAWDRNGCRGAGIDRSSSTVASATISSTTGEFKTFSLATSVINLTGDTNFVAEMDSGDGESGDYVVWDSSEATDSQRWELEVVTSAAGGVTEIPPKLFMLDNQFATIAGSRLGGMLEQ